MSVALNRRSTLLYFSYFVTVIVFIITGLFCPYSSEIRWRRTNQKTETRLIKRGFQVHAKQRWRKTNSDAN